MIHGYAIEVPGQIEFAEYFPMSEHVNGNEIEKHRRIVRERAWKKALEIGGVAVPCGILSDDECVEETRYLMDN